MADHHETVVVKDTDSGAGPLAAVIIAILLVVFGWWAFTTFSSGDAEVVPDEINITVDDSTGTETE